MSFASHEKVHVNKPFVDDQQVINVQLDSKDQTDDEQTIGYGGRGRGRLESKRVENKLLDVVRQILSFPHDMIPSTIKENVSHPGMVRNRKRESVPVQVFIVTEDTIDNTESRLQV